MYNNLFIKSFKKTCQNKKYVIYYQVCNHSMIQIKDAKDEHDSH